MTHKTGHKTEYLTKVQLRDLSHRIKQVIALYDEVERLKDPEHLHQLICDSICKIIGTQFCVLTTVGKNDIAIEYVATHPLHMNATVKKLDHAAISTVINKRVTMKINGFLAAAIYKAHTLYGFIYVAHKLDGCEFNQYDSIIMNVLITELALIYETYHLKLKLRKRIKKMHQQPFLSSETLHALKNSEYLLYEITQRIDEVFWQVSPKLDKVLYVSPGYAKIWQRSVETLYQNPRSWLETIVPEDRAKVEDIFINKLSLKGTSAVTTEYAIIRPNGSIRHIYDRGFALKDANGKVTSIIGIATDVTDLTKGKMISKVLFDGHEIFKRFAEIKVSDIAILQLIVNAFNWCHAELWVLNDSDNVLICEAHASKKDYMCDNILVPGRNAAVMNNADFAHDVYHHGVNVWISNYFKNACQTAVGIPVIFNDKCIGALTFYSVYNEEKDFKIIEALVMIATRLAEFRFSKSAELEINQYRTRDKLTGLMNIQEIHKHIDHIISVHPKQPFIFMLIDIDNLKIINEVYGYQLANEVVKLVANRFRDSLLDQNDLLANIGADKFVTTIFRDWNQDQVAGHAAKILEMVSKPISINNIIIFITARIGISLYPKDARDFTALLKTADIATEIAKSAGGNCFKFYRKFEELYVKEELSLNREMKLAMNSDQFIVYYQPKVDLKTGDIVGLEALIRWLHPERGLLYPSAFLNKAEEAGLIVPISELMMQRVFKDISSGKLNVPVSINLSIIQFRNHYDVVAFIKKQMREYRLRGDQLEFEVTENILMLSEHNSINVLNQLKQLGCKVSFDDFGSGYSSMSYLKYFQPNTIKLDRQFIDNINEEPNLSIVRAVILLAHALKCTIVAEGVETEEQMTILMDLGCDQLQGYYFYRPMPIDDVISIIRKKTS